MWMSAVQRITIDPEICHGKPCVRGLRYPVETILELLSSGMTPEDVSPTMRISSTRIFLRSFPLPHGSARQSVSNRPSYEVSRRCPAPEAPRGSAARIGFEAVHTLDIPLGNSTPY